MTFQNLEIIRPILDAISLEGYENPSPIQVEAMPIIFSGRDLLASAQTGTGKTAAFAIPIIQSLSLNQVAGEKRLIKALVLAPTRELAEQIKTSFRTYASKLNIKVGAVYGGVAQKGQESMLTKGIDILVATPGRLIDLMKQHLITLGNVKYFVLDEADTLLDMGFINDVKYIKGFIPKERQTMMFSATISKGVASLASTILNNPTQLELAPQDLMLENINHSMFYANKNNKNELLLDLLTNSELASVLVFTRTKHGANDLVKFLLEYGLKVDAIHGNKTQAKRQIALDNFKAKRTRVLVATDIAARGIDIDDLSHVINYDLPENGETYIHRIGRTGRKGLKGEAISFCSKNEIGLLKAIQKHTGLTIKVLKLEAVSADSKFKKVVEGVALKEKAEDEPKIVKFRNKVDKYFDKKLERLDKKNNVSPSQQVEQSQEPNNIASVAFKQEDKKVEQRKAPFSQKREYNSRRLSDKPLSQMGEKIEGQTASETKGSPRPTFGRKPAYQRDNGANYQNRPSRQSTYRSAKSADSLDSETPAQKPFQRRSDAPYAARTAKPYFNREAQSDDSAAPKSFRKPFQRSSETPYQSRPAKPNTWRTPRSGDSAEGDKSFPRSFNKPTDTSYQSRDAKPKVWRNTKANDGNGFDKTAQKPFQRPFAKAVESSGEKRVYKDRKPFNSYSQNSSERPFRSNDRQPTSGERTFGRRPSNRPAKSFSRNNKKD